MHKFKAIASTIHVVVKFHTVLGIGTIQTKRRLGQMEQTQNEHNANNDLSNLEALKENRSTMKRKGKNSNRNTSPEEQASSDDSSAETCA